MRPDCIPASLPVLLNQKLIITWIRMTNNSNIFVMATIFYAPSRMFTVKKTEFIPCAINLIQPNWSSSWSVFSIILHIARIEAHHPANDVGHVVVTLAIIANSSPCSIVKDFKPSSRGVGSIHETNI